VSGKRMARRAKQTAYDGDAPLHQRAPCTAILTRLRLVLLHSFQICGWSLFWFLVVQRAGNMGSSVLQRLGARTVSV
jgi:hypothetical protein